MKKLLLITFLLSPVASFAGDNAVQNDLEVFNRIKDTEQVIEVKGDMTTLRSLVKDENGADICFRDVVNGQTTALDCFHYTPQDLEK